ncbi:MAG: chromosome segregation protein SMC [Clostridiaceae bacterium]|nr:chromosome segregation protein SMC [Clostridiaceae bacterium]
MYLKSLEVHGFKSFAHKLLFEFHNGITAIVGPNGSGKSNVADAVRWVLGEQSAKQLRGSKMEDVIFAGTQLRKPLGYAYVAITISNEDHKLAIPYEEVKIARRVYRSGESEYLLNGASCRLKDVQELLFDTGIGKEGYSIIGQGQIDKILSGKPEERRELFDEAAGIVKYKKRKAAAEKNLEEERRNLVRIEDILSELEKQVGPLKKQSEKAKEYLLYRDELRNLDINLFLSEYDRMQGELAETAQKQEIAAADLKETEREFDQTKEEYVAAEAALEAQNRSLEQHRELLSADNLSLNQAESEIKILNEQIHTVQQNQKHNQEQTSSLHARLDAAKQEYAGYEKQKQEQEQTLLELEQEQSANKEQMAAMSRQITLQEQELEQCKQDIITYLNENTDVKSDQQRIRTLQEQNNLKKAEITKQILENKAEASIFAEAMEKEAETLNDLSDKLAAINDNIAEWNRSCQALQEQEQNLQREYRDTQQKYHMDHSRLVSLQNLTERYEGFGQSIRRVMEQKQNQPGIVGVVADIIRVKKEYELAVETALGGSIQNIVTDNEQTAKAMITYLKKNRYGRATFLPLTNIKAKPVNLSGGILSEPGVIGMASALVEADGMFSGLVEYLLGRFVVTDNIDNAIALAKKYHHTVRIVTTEGDLLNPGGSMSGGAYKNNNNLLGRRREMDDLTQQTGKQKERLKELSSLLQEKELAKKELAEKISGSQKVKQDLVLRQNTAKLNYDRAKQDLDKNQEKLELIRLDSSELEQTRENLRQDIEKINQKIQSNEALSKEREEKVQELTAKLEEKKKIFDTLSDEDSGYLLELAAQKQSREFLDENLARISDSMDTLEKELADVVKSGDDAGEQVLQKEQEIADTRQHIEDIRQHIDKLNQGIEDALSERDKLTQEHKSFFEKREELSARKSDLDKECFRLANQREKIAERMDSQTNYMWEQYELTYHTAKENRSPVDYSMAQIKSEIGRLKNQMKALGDVNINAIEQYQEVEERYQLLNTQHNDLIEAAQVLEGIIEELDTGMRKQFEEQFAEIRERFDGVFRELFGGGRGTLELTEEENILESGIRIVAQPPGKKLQNMMQLSGGEKALTAIALLFAIQSLKPSPFCLLDEIEAALDDSNVGRYAEYLHKLTKDTQFIVITHRRGTMNAADRLYGITMQEKGVSTLVSVNLLDETEIAQ